ncbi:TonB-dependent receptor plug domain-containing protein [Sabulicella rubraurantiaca]|uniref:TonB-dependent receptor plug domain-containing protein n=1 Tax=Sabulicella rubraurantiaca TaxID=2811429 RepID=UPI001A964D04|nr:TonB-dependent receptor [Sabulicella rubraurantiaca]
MRRLSFAAALLAATPAAAQVALPDTIVTATRAPTTLERVPAAITVITRQTIEERGFQTLAEALAIVPGLRLAASGGIGQQASVFLRGNSSRSTLVLLDGVPVNDPAEANGAFNFGNELLFDVERIEVLRGPASSLYGGSALGGVINLVTRRAPPDRAFVPYGEIAGGTQRTLRVGAGATGTVGQFDYLASVNSLSTQGFNATASRFQRTLNERDGFRGTAATARLGWTPLAGTRVEGLLRWRENRFGLDSVPRDDPNFTGDDRRWFGQLRGETTLFGGAWTTGLRVAHGSDRRVYSNLPDQLSAASGTDRYLGERTTVDWGNTVRLPGFGAFTDGQASFGFTHARESARSIAGAVPFQTRVNASQDVNAGHAAVQYRIWERLDLSAGLRHDAAGGFSDTTWRLGAVLQVPELNLRLRAAGGSAFNAPALFQRFGAIGTSFRGNPNLRPERSLGYEVGAELDIPAFGRPAFATLGATFFQSRVTDLINYNAQFSTLVNVDRVAIKGAELGVALRPTRWLSAELSWTITDATDRATGRPLPRRPEHVINATLRAEPLPGLVVAPTLLFTGRSPEGPFASYTDAGASIAGPRRNKTGTVLNITVSYRVTPQVTAFLEGRNLGGSKWEPVNGFQVPGRSLLVGTRFTF